MVLFVKFGRLSDAERFGTNISLINSIPNEDWRQPGSLQKTLSLSMSFVILEIHLKVDLLKAFIFSDIVPNPPIFQADHHT